MLKLKQIFSINLCAVFSFAVWRSPVLSSCWLTVRLLQDFDPQIIIWPHPEGANTANFHPLKKASASRSTLYSPKMALINAHSLVNKTFLLNDFISFQNLDFLFITIKTVLDPAVDCNSLSTLQALNLSYYQLTGLNPLSQP